MVISHSYVKLPQGIFTWSTCPSEEALAPQCMMNQSKILTIPLGPNPIFTFHRWCFFKMCRKKPHPNILPMSRAKLGMVQVARWPYFCHMVSCWINMSSTPSLFCFAKQHNHHISQVSLHCFWFLAISCVTLSLQRFFSSVNGTPGWTKMRVP